MRLHREWNPSNLPRPGIIWCFEGTHIQFGVQLADWGSDAVAAISIASDISETASRRLCWTLDHIGAAICAVVGHNYEAVSYPPNTPENPRNHLYFDRKQCTRCMDLQPRKVNT